MVKQKEKIDPIRDAYYQPLATADSCSTLLFYGGAVLSLALPYLENSGEKSLYEISQILFVVFVIANFTIGWLIRFYFSPRAESKRLEDFLSHAFGARTNNEVTKGYYNSGAGDPARKIAAQLLENSFHSKDTAARMVVFERTQVLVYFSAFLVTMLTRSSSLGTIAIVAQVFFSEQVLSRWLRTEWLRREFEQTYDNLYRLICSKPDPTIFAALVHHMLGRYESAKINACVTLSARIFGTHREENARKWGIIRKELGL